jgi:hypothetical protein
MMSRADLVRAFLAGEEAVRIAADALGLEQAPSKEPIAAPKVERGWGEESKFSVLCRAGDQTGSGLYELLARGAGDGIQTDAFVPMDFDGPSR